MQWELVAADEGSAKGAAIIAAVVEKLKLWMSENSEKSSIAIEIYL